MRFDRVWMVAAFAAAISGAGCKGDDDTKPPAPQTYAFQGSVDPKFVGTWATDDGSSTMQMKPDGSLKMVAVQRNARGKSSQNIAGQWLAQAPDKFLLRYGFSGQPEVVLRYTYRLSPTKLELQQAGLKTKTTYRKH